MSRTLGDFHQCDCGVRTEVTDSRFSLNRGETPYIRRRRQCPKCGFRFTTMEVVCDSGGGTPSTLPVTVDGYSMERARMKQTLLEKVTALIESL